MLSKPVTILASLEESASGEGSWICAGVAYNGM